jgi:NADPH-dependent ferric siderophore reductase
MTVTATPLPMLLAEVEVASTTRLSPSFVRIELAGAPLAELGVDGPWLDQRIKLVVPHADGGLTSVDDADETWLTTWLDRPVEERGHMRTYSVRDVVGSGIDTRLVVDIVLHPFGGEAGPGSDWAAAAQPGDRVVVLAPRRGFAFGGIEFAPPAGSRLLLVGDETAVPAICRILGDLPDDAVGTAYLEVPHTLDVQDVRRPAGVDVRWLVRGERPHGERMHAAVVDHLGTGPVTPVHVSDVDPDLWETPTYSSSGEPLPVAPEPVDLTVDLTVDLYAWIAGESAMVTGLRRHLVREVGVDRRQVAFMGYWRRGVAMRS